jgi:hypothetical protein
LFEALRQSGFQIDFTSHAEAILRHDFPEVEGELSEALLSVSIPVSELIESGGGEAKVTQRLRRALSGAGWLKRNVTVKKIINGVEKESVTHEVDHIRDYGPFAIALEIEWNNKDPFFDRDLETFKRLHSEGAFSVGVIVTRGETFQQEIRSIVQEFALERGVQSFPDFPPELDYRPSSRFIAAVDRRVAATGRPFPEVWAEGFCSDKYGQATTHWKKLETRIARGVGNPCPLLMIGIPKMVIARGPAREA